MAVVRQFSPLERIIVSQAKSIEYYLKQLGIDMPVEQEIQKRRAKQYDGLVFAHAGVFEANVAMLLGGEGSRYKGRPIRSILIPSTIEGSFAIDENRYCIGAKQFFVIENGKIIPVQTNEPVDVHGVNMNCLDRDTYVVHKDFQINQIALGTLLGNKQHISRQLELRGVNTTKGQLVLPNDEAGVKKGIEEIVRDHTEFVVKPLRGCQGDGVRFFTSEEAEEAIEYVQTFKAPDKVLIEGRVQPPKLHDEEGNRLDWNIRSLVAMPINGEAPQLIDAEVRHRIYGKEPVNINKGADAGEWKWAAEIAGIEYGLLETRSVQVAKVIKELAGIHNIPAQGFIGLDLIGDDLRVMEVNGQNAGGIATLTRLRKEPVDGVAKVLLPTLGEWLEENRDKHHERYQPMICTKEGTYELVKWLRHANLKEEAIAAYDNALKKYPKERLMIQDKGRLLFNLERHEETQQTLRPLVRGHEIDGEAAIILAESYRITDKVGDAIALMERVIGMSDAWQFRLMMGRLYTTVDDYGKAKEHLEQIAERRKDDVEVQYNLGSTYYNLKDYEKAKEKFERCHEIEPGSTQGITALINTYMELGLDSEIEPFLLHVLHRNPEDPQALCLMGQTLAFQDRNEEALEYFEKATNQVEVVEETYKWHSLALRYMGLCYLSDRDFPRVLEIGCKMHELDPEGAYSYDILIPAYAGLGCMGVAYELMKEYEEKFPDHGVNKYYTRLLQDVMEDEMKGSRIYMERRTIKLDTSKKPSSRWKTANVDGKLMALVE